MPESTPLTRKQLADRFGGAAFQESLIQHLSIVQMLSSCIIRRGYVIPDKINVALSFTEAGKRVRDEMIKSEKVPVKEARLLTYLAMVHVEPLIDFEKTDAKALVEAISEEVASGEMLFPLTFGRDLYCAAAELFPEEREYLRHDDTMKLLERTPRGVFHLEEFLVGPFGIIVTDFRRSIRPRTRVPLQHCSDPSCNVVHRVQLATSIEAGVNKHRPALNKVLDSIARDPSDWSGYISDLRPDEDERFRDASEVGVPYIIGDGLSDEELRQFAAYALDETGGRLRAVCERVGIVMGPSDKMVAGRDRGELIQLLLAEDDTSLVQLLDRAVRSGVIAIADGETRLPKLNSAVRATVWRLQPQLSGLGYRSTAAGQSHANLRLAALVRELYNPDEVSDQEALSWILRDRASGSLLQDLDEYLRVEEPPEVVRRIVLDRRQNVARAAERLGVDRNQNDESIVKQILWKLGFKVGFEPKSRADYWSAHRRFERAAKASGSPLSTGGSDLRAAGADYAVALEAYLTDAVSFACWAMYNDHYASTQAFVYRESNARAAAREILSDEAARQGNSRFEFNDKPTLSVLIDSFGVLARGLEFAVSGESSHVRSRDTIPRFAANTDMQEFPFKHTIPFLDLTADARGEVVALLLEATSQLGASKIAEHRNNLLHANRAPSESAVLVEALSVVNSVMVRLEYAGLAPRVYGLSDTAFDRWGRGQIVLVNEDGESVVIPAPSRFDLLRLPGSLELQYVMRSAVFGEGGGVLRFRRGFDSPYEEYWSEFPSRRERGNVLGGDRSDSLATPVEAGAFVSSRAD